jgi:large subunit ribosomal protein L10
VKAFRKEKEHERLKIKAGIIEGQILNAEGVENQLATMPGKNELRATLLATMAAPMQQFLQQLNAPLQNFVYVLKAKEDAASSAG